MLRAGVRAIVDCMQLEFPSRGGVKPVVVLVWTRVSPAVRQVVGVPGGSECGSGFERRAGGVGSGWWVAAVGGGAESDGALLVLFDSISAAVDDDVVVVPAQGDQIVGIVGAAVA